MGKDKSKKRHRSDSSSSSGTSSGSDHEDARRAKKDKKKHKKSKDKDKKGSKSRSKDDLVRQARAFLEQQLAGASTAAGPPGGGGGGAPVPSCGLGAPAGSGPLPPVQVKAVKELLTDEDYFRRHAEFSAFLAEERRTKFNELSSDRSRELFSEFVVIWNEGRLAPRYYAGLVAAPVRRTEYRWAFGAAGKGPAAAVARGGGSGSGAGALGAAAASTGMAAFMEDQRTTQAGARLDARQQDRLRGRELLEEVAPRETGRDKMVAERAARRQLARAGDDDGPGGYVPGGGGGDLMGGGDSFAAAKAREARRVEGSRQRGVVRGEEVAQRAAAYQAKEEEKLAGLRALLARGPITIAKRG